uniref:Uncharacterized protein n=1 Tax=Lotharella globosa TaxID=91324 RepID=A0A7S3ZDE9_9EUKA
MATPDHGLVTGMMKQSLAHLLDDGIDRSFRIQQRYGYNSSEWRYHTQRLAEKVMGVRDSFSLTASSMVPPGEHVGSNTTEEEDDPAQHQHQQQPQLQQHQHQEEPRPTRRRRRRHKGESTARARSSRCDDEEQDPMDLVDSSH